MDWEAAKVSFLLALATVLALLPLGLWLGRWLATTMSAARPWIEALVMLPLLLPPTVLGFYLLGLFGKSGLSFSFSGLVLASVLINIPFMVQPVQRSFAAIPNSLREAAYVSGLSSWQTFRQVELPLAWAGVASGIALTIAHTLGEFGVVLMVGGNVGGQTRTLSVAIYDKVQAFDWQAAHIMAASLVLVSLLALAVVFLVGERRGRALAER
jgi:molybdate transport system permease protein